MKPEISVVVTVFNIEKYIAECLDSILSQQDAEIEVVCVNDCSTDKSLDILMGYARKDKRVKVFNTCENSGLASARNLGIKKSNGRYIYNIDGDDKLENGALKTMLYYMRKYSLDMLSFSAYSFFDDEELKKFGTENEYIRKYDYPGVWDGKELFAKLVDNGDRVNGNTVLYCFDSGLIKNNNLFLPEGVRYCDDRMFSNFMKAKRVMCINDALYLRRYRQGSVVTSKMKKIFLESMILCFVSEQILWRNVCDDATEYVNDQIEKYFDQRIDEIVGFEWMFKDDKSKMSLIEKHPMERFLYERIFKKKSIYSMMISDDDKKRINKSKKIYVYGAGFVAKKVVNVFAAEGIKKFDFVVTRKTDDYFEGHNVFEIDEIKQEEGLFFVVAVSEKYQGEIEEVLISRGHRDYCLVKEV